MEDISIDNSYSGSITISNRKNIRIKRVTSKSDFFNSDIKYKITHDAIIFEKPTLIYSGKTIRPSKHKRGYFEFDIISEDIPAGKYNFDEGSTEDCVIIYYHTK